MLMQTRRLLAGNWKAAATASDAASSRTRTARAILLDFPVYNTIDSIMCDLITQCNPIRIHPSNQYHHHNASPQRTSSHRLLPLHASLPSRRTPLKSTQSIAPRSHPMQLQDPPPLHHHGGAAEGLQSLQCRRQRSVGKSEEPTHTYINQSRGVCLLRA